MVLGREKGLVLIDGLENTEAVLVGRTQAGAQIYLSQGLIDKLCIE